MANPILNNLNDQQLAYIFTTLDEVDYYNDKREAFTLLNNLARKYFNIKPKIEALGNYKYEIQIAEQSFDISSDTAYGVYKNAIKRLKDYLLKQVEGFDYTLPKDTKPTINNSNVNKYLEDILKDIPDTNTLLKVIKLNISNTVTDSTPAFILPDGRVINVNENNLVDPVHSEVILSIAIKLLDYKYGEDGWECELYTGPDKFMQLLTDKYGWLRVNPGTTEVDSRFYMVLPSASSFKLTDAQYNKLLDFLYIGYEAREPYVGVFGGSTTPIFHKYSFTEYTPDDILKKIKRYYSSGILYEETTSEQEY